MSAGSVALPSPSRREDYLRCRDLIKEGRIEDARKQTRRILAAVGAHDPRNLPITGAIIERIARPFGIRLLDERFPDTDQVVATAPEHAAAVPRRALDLESVYPKTASAPAHSVRDDIELPVYLSPETDRAIRVTTDEWANLLSDPEKGRLRASQASSEILSLDAAEERISKWQHRARAQRASHGSDNFGRTILSLFDHTGAWSQPYVEAGYNVLRFDIQDGYDVNDFSVGYFVDNFDITDVYGVLAACPCTDFAVSGARHFAAKDADGRTEASKELVFQTLRTIEYFRPKFWALENPVSRIERLVGLPKSRYTFDPCHFGSPYTKKTVLWGRFNAALPTAPVDPTEGSKMHRLYGGSSMRTKNARSETPLGFAYAFFAANNFVDACPIERTVDDYPEASGAVREAFAAGMTEEQIREVMADTYENYETRAAIKALAHHVYQIQNAGPGL